MGSAARLVEGAHWVPSVLGSDGARRGESWPGGKRLRALCSGFL